MTEISRLKYIQWRPIGVCDKGEGKRRKAKIFSKADFLRVTSPGIERLNWRKNKKVIEIIKLYAKDVSKMSSLTDGMANPEISKIELVGAVIGHNQTPNLNKESVDGKVQFFQVSFKDGKNKKSSKIKWKNWLVRVVICFVIIMSLVLIYFFYNYFSELSLKKVQKSVMHCSTNRKDLVHLKELKDIRKSLIDELSSLPGWIKFKEIRLHCAGSGIDIDVNNQEKLLLDCYIKVRNRTKNIVYKDRPNYYRIEKCAINLCKRNLKHLASKCIRL